MDHSGNGPGPAAARVRGRGFGAAIAVALCWASVAAAGTFDIGVSDDSIRLHLAAPLPYETLDFDAGWLHGDSGVDVAAAGIHVVDYAGTRGDILVGVGARLYYVDADSTDGGAVALGGFARIPLSPSGRAGVAGGLYYAPDASSFGDLTGFLEYDFRAFFQVIEPADVYVGYRRLRGSFDGAGGIVLDRGLHFGLVLTF